MVKLSHDTRPAGQSPIVEVSDESFVAEVLDAGLPVLVDFMAQWCGPCKMMGPIFAEVAVEYAGRVKFVKVDVDASPQVAGALQISSIPTFALFAGNQAVAAGVGAMRAADLRRWIDEALTRIPAPDAESAPASA
jgi:thioredoxin 1